MATEPGRNPEADERAVAEAQREIYEHVQHLHDQGVINLDAPAREVIDVIDKEYPPRSDDAAHPAAGYWLAGDRGWCNHLHDPPPPPRLPQ